MKYDLTNSIDANSAQLYLNKLIEEGAKIELKKIRGKRTLKQNSYFHVVITIFAMELGYTIEEAKTMLKRMYSNSEPSMVYQKKGYKFLRSTTTMDTKELTNFIEWIRNYAAIDAGIYIPTSEEYLINQYNIDKQIEQNKQYL
jgi:hypothetical protein